MQFFLKRPIIKKLNPINKFLKNNFFILKKLIWGIISWYLTIGPAINWGKKRIKNAYLIKFFGIITLFFKSTKYVICWNVKKEIAKGNSIFAKLIFSWKIKLILSLIQTFYQQRGV